MDIKKFLATIPFLHEFSPLQIEKLAYSIEIKSFIKNSTIFFEGQKADCFYIVYSGKVKIFKLARSGKEHILHIANPTDIVAEVPMFSGENYPANCIAMENSVLLSLSRERLSKLIQEEPQIALNLLVLQAQRLREFTLQIENLSTKDTLQRLTRYILAKSKLINGEEICQLDISLTALANMLGVTRENLSRTLSKLVKLKYIAHNNKQITILNKSELIELMRGQVSIFTNF